MPLWEASADAITKKPKFLTDDVNSKYDRRFVYDPARCTQPAREAYTNRLSYLLFTSSVRNLGLFVIASALASHKGIVFSLLLLKFKNYDANCRLYIPSLT
jgi:hypothetical protein